mgnify:CR=1 FL=1
MALGILRRTLYSTLFSVGVFFVSIGAKIIPCKTLANVPNAIGSWGTCSLNPDTYIGQTVQKLFFGYTKSLTEAYLLTLILSFIIAFTFLHFLAKKKKKE